MQLLQVPGLEESDPKESEKFSISMFDRYSQYLIDLTFRQRREKKINQVNIIGYTPLSLGEESIFSKSLTNWVN